MRDVTYQERNHYLYHKPTLSLNFPKLSDSESQTISAMQNESNTDLIIQSSPAERFVLNVFDETTLEIALVKLKKSVWWNAGGFFFIEYGSSPNHCKDLDSFFDVIWDLNILSVVVACLNSNFSTDLYSYNPFSERAPTFWHKIGHHSQKNGRLVTLYKNSSALLGSYSSCSDLYFDKTVEVKNYPINLGVSGVKRYNEIVNLVWDSLGVNVTRSRVHHDSLGVVSNNSANGTMADVLRAKYDMIAIIDYERGFWRNNMQTFITKDLCYVVKKKNLPMSSRLLKLYSPSVWITKFIIMSILVIVFMSTSKRGIIWNIMNVYRATLGHAMLHPPKSWCIRIIMISFIFKQLVMINVSQSQLTLTLATDQSKHVDIIKDGKLILNAKHYKIFGTIYYRRVIFGSDDKRPFFDLVEDFDVCLTLMKFRDDVICIDNCLRLKSYELDPKTSIIRDPLFSRNGILLVRDDFPLQKRFHDIYVNLFERGIILHTLAVKSWQQRSQRDNIPDEQTMISLRKLRVCFYILCVAHMCSFTVLIIEIFFHHFKTHSQTRAFT
ncbi:hypothetical protein QAD02_022552 [Eretmocerus hayati]|uniref:Uncharacterized protein n=1 Tax=Eretmocerus hayati TaxID=131215 RepID=A0ACC2PUX6_9HYME|nr:hypothetical protein QAD02_022552 [Eretmocerus hayati]